MGFPIADLSEYNTVDLSRYPYPAVILRARGETREDHAFAERRAYAARRGLYTGLYAFLSASTRATDQAADFARIVGRLGPREFAILDLETGSNPTSRALDWVRTTDAALSCTSWVYTPASWISSGAFAVRVLGPRPLWIAEWGRNDGTTGGAIRPVGAHSLWQYTSRGRAAFVTGDVDFSWFEGTPAQFGLLVAGGHRMPNPPTPALPHPIVGRTFRGRGANERVIGYPVPNVRILTAEQCPELAQWDRDEVVGGWVTFLQAKFADARDGAGYYGDQLAEVVKRWQVSKGYPANGVITRTQCWPSLGQAR